MMQMQCQRYLNDTKTLNGIKKEEKKNSNKIQNTVHSDKTLDINDVSTKFVFEFYVENHFNEYANKNM